MAAAERITFAGFQERFQAEEDCREYLYRQRFPKGFVCPKCGGTEYYPIYRRNLCQCKQCRKQTSVTAGTVMHRTHLSLVTWFWAIYLSANDKRGISATQLSNLLHIGYESAWYLLKRIRSAMGQRDANYLLSGLLEMDEGYWGSRRAGKRGRGTSQKKIVVALSKTGEEKVPMYLRMQEVPNVQRKTLQEFVDAHVQGGANIECDGFKAYQGLKNVSVKATTQEWDGWLRRRLRMYIWKQWKNPKTRIESLKKLGMPEWLAYRNGYTRKGYWRIAGSGILNSTITNERLARAGYYSFSDRYESLHSNG